MTPNRTRAASRHRKNFLRESFALEQGVLASQLELAKQSIIHPGKKGDVSEKHIINKFRSYLPHRYSVDSAFVIDCKGNTSHQIDVVIYDKQYTPSLLDQYDHKYIPAEAVYAVFEVKPTINATTLAYAANKANSVRRLHRTLGEIFHLGGQQRGNPHFDIVAGIISRDTGWSNGFDSAFLRLIRSYRGSKLLDCGLALSGDCFFMHANKIKIVSSGHALAYFMFTLLNKLSGFGTVRPIEWSKYANLYAPGVITRRK